MLSTKTKIASAVLSLHILALISPLFFPEKELEKKNTPIIVTTYIPPVEAKKITTTTSSQKQKTTSLKKTIPTPAKKSSPTTKKKKTETKPSPKPSTVKKHTDSLQKELQNIQKSIAKIEEENDKIGKKSTLKDPPKISFSQTASTSEIDKETDDAYANSLANYLQMHLQLPDIGEVKIQLTLLENGTVEKIVVLSAKSERNRKRLEEELPKLTLPALPKKRAPSRAETFVLTFCNEQ